MRLWRVILGMSSEKISPSYFTEKFFFFEISGSEAKSFLQKQSTYNIENISPNTFQLISLLSPKGIVESFGFLIHADSKYLYAVSISEQEASKQRLERFLISEDVEIVEEGIREVYFTLHSVFSPGVKGHFIYEDVSLSFERPSLLPIISPSEKDDLVFLSGYPNFSKPADEKIILNYSSLASLVLSYQKGCYPGQEIVLKLNSGRGAAYSTVLLKLEKDLKVGDIAINGKKVGTILEVRRIGDSLWAKCSIIRDFRVDQLNLLLEQESQVFKAHVQYYPALSFSLKSRAELLYDLGTEAFLAGDNEQALSYFKQSTEIHPIPDVLESMGVLLGRMERFHEAIKVMDQLQTIDPSSVLSHTNKSLFYMKLGLIKEAEDEKSAATIKSFQKFGQEAQEKEKIVAEEKRKQDELLKREQMFLDVLQIDPDDSLALFGLGSIEYERGNLAKAQELLRRTISVDRDYTQAYLYLGKTLLKENKSEAKEVFLIGRELAGRRGELMVANQINQILIDLD